jgi:hypothetical protein
MFARKNKNFADGTARRRISGGDPGAFWEA